VSLLAVNGNTLYVGGAFTRVDGRPRNRVAAIDLRTGHVTPWNPSPSVGWSDVWAIAVSGNRVYLGGDFQRVGGRRRAWLAAVSRSDGRLEPWRPRLNGMVDGLVIIDQTVYVSGAFTKVSGEARGPIAAIDPITGATKAWNPAAADDSVLSLLA